MTQTNCPADKAMLKALIAFIIERHNIYLNKAARKLPPWTNDPILRKYKFCNMYRELDRVTIWIAENWRTPHKDDPDLWFAMLVARLVNWPDTLAEIGYPVPWNPKKFASAIRRREAVDEKVWSNAYMLTTNGVKADRVTYNLDRLGRIWAERKTLRPIPGEALMHHAEALQNCYGLGSFFAGQVIADYKYVPRFLTAPDWFNFAVSGPGSRRGLNRVLGYEVKAPWKEYDWHTKLLQLQPMVNKALPARMEHLHAQDLQNCLCEFDKYRRILEATDSGEFRRTLYPAGGA